MDSFDQSLKYLLQHAPADFIGFALGDAAVRVLEPVPTVLPSRGRDVDGAYLIARGGAPKEVTAEDKRVAHVELHRRHQALLDLAVDVAEAQIRLFRRERRLVVSHVWDLYGDADAPVFDRVRRRGFALRLSSGQPARPRLEELLSRAPPALWPLVALTRDGACEQVLERARDAIDARTTWSPAERADHLAVLWFVAEAEGVAGKLMRAYLSEERLMESELYKSIFGKGAAKGKAESILTVLSARGIAVSDTIRERVLGCTDMATLDVWVRRAAVAPTAAAVVRAKAPARARSS